SLQNRCFFIVLVRTSIPIKFIRANNSSRIIILRLDIQFFWYLSVYTKYRPVVFPLNRNQLRNSSDRAMILKQKSIPVSFRSVDEPALGNPVILQRYLTRIITQQAVRPVGKLRATITGRP